MKDDKNKKEKPDLLAVMEMHGIDTAPVQGKTKGMVRCAFHEDSGRPNCSVWVDSQTWHCFRCGIGGDVYDYAGHAMFKSEWNNRDRDMFRSVAEALKEGNLPKAEPREVKPPKPLTRQMIDLLGQAARVYQIALMGDAGKEARDYLEQRRIGKDMIRALRIGYAQPGMLAANLATYPPGVRQLAEDLGLFQEGREWLSGRIVFPDVALSGQVLYMAGRSLQPEAKLRYLGLPIRKTMYLMGRASRQYPLLVTESVIDTVNFWEMQFQGAGVNGTGLQQHWAAELNKWPVVCFARQNDDAGRDAVERWKTLVPQGREILIPEKYKDVNDIVKDVGLQEARKIILAALKKANVHIN